MGFIDIKHWFLMTSLDLKSMDMELFAHNHARFIGLDVINPQFHAAFDFANFAETSAIAWRAKNSLPKSRDLKIVFNIYTNKFIIKKYVFAIHSVRSGFRFRLSIFAGQCTIEHQQALSDRRSAF